MDDLPSWSEYSKADSDLIDRTFGRDNPHYGKPLPLDRQANADMERCHSIISDTGGGVGFVAGVAVPAALAVATVATTPAAATGVGGVIPTSLAAAGLLSVPTIPLVALEVQNRFEAS